MQVYKNIGFDSVPCFHIRDSCSGKVKDNHTPYWGRDRLSTKKVKGFLKIKEGGYG